MVFSDYVRHGYGHYLPSNLAIFPHSPWFSRLDGSYGGSDDEYSLISWCLCLTNHVSDGLSKIGLHYFEQYLRLNSSSGGCCYGWLTDAVDHSRLDCKHRIFSVFRRQIPYDGEILSTFWDRVISSVSMAHCGCQLYWYYVPYLTACLFCSDSSRYLTHVCSINSSNSIDLAVLAWHVVASDCSQHNTLPIYRYYDVSIDCCFTFSMVSLISSRRRGCLCRLNSCHLLSKVSLGVGSMLSWCDYVCWRQCILKSSPGRNCTILAFIGLRCRLACGGIPRWDLVALYSDQRGDTRDGSKSWLCHSVFMDRHRGCSWANLWDH